MSKAELLRIPDYLEHIIEAIGRIHRYVEDMDEIAFLEDDKTKDAVVRNLEIMGEAARNIERYHADFARLHSEVPWELVYAMRNRVAHGYFQLDYEMVWKSVHHDLPPLYQAVKALLDSAGTP